MNQGGSNRLIYDACDYNQRLYESTEPLTFALYLGKFENCNKCRADKFWKPTDPEMVDVESELRNQTRPGTRCGNMKYNPNCEKSKVCTSTFDSTIPIVPAPECCPIVHNNIPKQTHPGYVLPSPNFC